MRGRVINKSQKLYELCRMRQSRFYAHATTGIIRCEARD
jgi:hypothetical protein